MLTFGEHAHAVLHNALGHYETALDNAQRASAQDELHASVWSLPELVEAAARSGQPELAADALERLRERTQVAGTEWALGIEARCAALLSDGGSPRASTARRSNASAAVASRSTSLARICFTANGCADADGASTRASSSEPRMRGSWKWVPRRSRSAPTASSWRPARRPASEPSRRRDELTPHEAQDRADGARRRF